MIEISFDGRRVVVPAGTNLVEAGLRAGVTVPVFCYQRDLGAVGACRVCAVTVERDGRRGLAMACMTRAENGQRVTTADPASVAFRRWVLEWLMVNHPHDCPICDEGGECQLQDLTVAAGHGRRRLRPRKRTFASQDLGAFLAHEMNRCITCYRCSRFYQEFAGGRDFGVTGSRGRVYFGRFAEGPLASPFSGNLVELCPTGVFTDRLFRYRSRVWDLAVAPSVCPHCSVGCNVLPGPRHRELQRVRVRDNPAVNGVFLCDRGQFGHAWVEETGRPRSPRADGEDCTWDRALELAAGRLRAVAADHGAGGVALLASPRASLETHVALAALAAGPLAGARVAHFDDPAREERALAALAALAAAGAEPLDQADIAGCDVLLVAGALPVDEAPLVALAARQVVRRGGRLFLLGVAETYLGAIAEQVVAVHPAHLSGALERLAGALGDGGKDRDPIAAALHAASNPGVLLGSDLVGPRAAAAAASLAHALRRPGRTGRLGFLFPGPNGFGAAALSPAPALADVLAAVDARRVRAALVAESDLDDLGDRVGEAFGRLDLLVVLDHTAHGLAQAAHLLLPTTVPYECDGIFVNRAGRAQAFARAGGPGLPVGRLIERERFPRRPAAVPPGGDPRPAWWVLEHVRERAGGPPASRSLERLRDALASGSDFWRPIAGLAPGTEGRCLEVALLPHGPPGGPAHPVPADPFSLFRIDRTLGSEPLSRRAPAQQSMAGPPAARVSPADARRLGLSGRVRIEAEGHTVELDLAIVEGVPDGVVLVPRDVAWRAPIAPGARATLHRAGPGGTAP